MLKRVRFLWFIMFLLVLVRIADAQSLEQSKNGTITVHVQCNCQLITEKSNQPLHFMPYGKTQRDTKHIKIQSNCSWNLRVVSNKNNGDDNNDKNCKEPQNTERITYSLKNIRGKGKLLYSSEMYELGSSPQNMPSGIGEIEFDVVFELEGKESKKDRWGEENTWVSFYVLPKE